MRTEHDPLVKTTDPVDRGPSRDIPPKHVRMEAATYRRRFQSRSCDVLSIAIIGIVLIMIGSMVIVSAAFDEPDERDDSRNYWDDYHEWEREGRERKATGQIVALAGITLILGSMFGAAVYCDKVGSSTRGMMFLGASLITFGLTLAIFWI